MMGLDLMKSNMPPLYKKFGQTLLTPLECERLQGFPDNFTKYDQDGNEISDTQRYKMCGNAVTVNVVEAVMTNLRKECYEKNQLQRT